MLSSATKSKYELITLRKRHSTSITICGSVILFLPIAIFIAYILLKQCPKQIIDETSEEQLIPLWISQRSQRNLLPNVNTNPDNTNYDPVRDALIFVSIAAFRDVECRNTVLQVMEQSKYPNRLRFGIFTQNNISDPDCADFRDVLNCDSNYDYSYLYKNDSDIPQATNKKQKLKGNYWSQEYRYKKHVLCGKLWQIKIDRVHWKDGLGPTYGRYRAELFYNNEEYVLQMDSHTAFIPNWDTLLIEMHMKLNNDFGVLTTYPKPLRYPTLWHWKPSQKLQNSQMYVICKTQILKDKITKSFKLKPARVIPNAGRPILTAFFAAGFSFQKGHRLVNVPYDPYSAYLFDGEEMSMAARMFTHGYDFYAPNLDVVYHLYSPNDNKIRPVFWEHEWNVKWKIARVSEYRINYILGLHMKFHPNVPFNKYDLREIDKYGLGSKREIEDFWNFTRIDFETFDSEDLCSVYKTGGMHEFRISWKNKTEDPYHPIS